MGKTKINSKDSVVYNDGNYDNHYIYEPHEDSFLMLRVSATFFRPGLRVLDIGTGSGILAIEAVKRGCQVMAVDINKEAEKALRARVGRVKPKLKSSFIHFVHSDLFSKVKGKFDLIVFNPPYLPSSSYLSSKIEGKAEDEIDMVRTAVEGGKYGYEVIVKFLTQAKNFLDKDGATLILFSSLTGKSHIDFYVKKFGYSKRQVGRKNLFFETLYVYLLKIMGSKNREMENSKS